MYNNLDIILRNLLVAGNIVAVPFEQMRERYAKNWADLLSLSFRELR